MKSKFEVWSHFSVSKKCAILIHEFFIDEYHIDPGLLVHNLHLTIYHSRRPMPGLQPEVSSRHLSIDTEDTRFMVLAPGGENPVKTYIPSNHLIGIRVKRTAAIRSKIESYRSRFYVHETKRVLGTRQPSTRSRSAFGAMNYQPHMTILKKNSGIISDLH